MYNDLERSRMEDFQAAGSSSETLGLHPFAQRQVLMRAVAKMVLLGEQVGVSIDEMILLLDAGLTVDELVKYLAQRSGQLSWPRQRTSPSA